jgi:hypothetical protein
MHDQEEDPLAPARGILFAVAIGLVFWAAVVFAAWCYHHGC